MNRVAFLSIAFCCLMHATSIAGCDYIKMLQQLKSNEIDLAEYTKRYTNCIGKVGGGKATPPPGRTQYGYQPSCTTDAAVTQAIAKFNNSGTFKGSDGQDYPFSVVGVVTFTQLNDLHTRIHAVIRGVSSFISDSDLFSLHVHQKGETNPSCSAPGGHYNPCGRDHNNDPRVENRHVGDVARITLPNDSDVLVIESIDPQVKLTGPSSVLGRSVVVHGGSGATRVGCGTIAVTEWEGQDHPDTIALRG